MDVKKKAQDNVPENTPETASEQEVVQETQEVQKEQKEQEPTAEEKLQKQIDELNDKLLRTLAEYDNYRKRSIKEKDAIYPQAKADTVEKFLPIIDNFERAMQTECSDEAFKKGIEMIFQSFIKTMTDLSVEEIGKEGETFNPDLHNAVMHVEDESVGDNIIVEELQKGYTYKGFVVRHSMVKVAN